MLSYAVRSAQLYHLDIMITVHNFSFEYPCNLPTFVFVMKDSIWTNSSQSRVYTFESPTETASSAWGMWPSLLT